jgi:peptidoglycan/xylan/chitin deacetylase (PgdA/CDA1 family)
MYTILTYHTIGDYGETLPAGINTPVETFSAHMEYLYQQRYRVILLDQMVDHIINRHTLNHKTLVITFDDGYEDHFLHAYPILKRYSFPATIFLTVEHIDGYWESEKAEGGRIRGLSKEHILAMRKEGLIQFGSHGCSHRNLLSMNGKQKDLEIRTSKRFLERMLGEEVPFISYPFGAFDDGIKDAVANAGYRAAFSIWNRKPDIYSIRRVPLHTRDRLAGFKFKLSPLYVIVKSVLRFT